MTAGRWALAAALAVFVGLPLFQPFLRFAQPEVWAWTSADLARVGQLALNTLVLVAGTLLLTFPPALFLALVLFRSDLPGRTFALMLVVVSLFVPLPVLVSAWQGMFGSDGLLPWTLWYPAAGRPWATGWIPALIVHAVAGLPWVTLIVGVGMRSIEPELEEEAQLVMPAWRVAFLVTLPCSHGSIVAAGLFLALFTASEISVTDMMLISTFAEEFHTQFTLGQSEALGRTLVLSLPMLVAMWVGVVAFGARIDGSVPALLGSHRPLRLPGRWLWAVGVFGALGVLSLPLVSLVWKVGLAGEPRAWSAGQAWHQVAAEGRLLGGQVLQTFGVALFTGALVAGLALVCCWLALESRPLRLYLLLLLGLAWLLPGPVVGIGLKELILQIVSSAPAGPWNDALYYGPSPVPIVWAATLRFLPPAAFFLWPVVRTIPVELREAARLDGASPLRELVQLAWPLTRRAVLVVAIAIAALCLGEVSAGARVETPGWESFAKLLFDRMHNGADATVAALTLLLLGSLFVLFVLIGVWRVIKTGNH